MRLQTASETLSFVREFEEKGAAFYEEMAQKFTNDEETFLTFAKENRKFLTQVQRAYYSVITDAIEGGYAFNLESDEYDFDTQLADDTSYADAVAKALNMEEKILDFYEEAAEQSMSLLADVPRNFKIVAKKRKNRIPKLESLS